ncbi:MAG: DNRLRE domain-containing protein [Opitutaceae bacterium]
MAQSIAPFDTAVVNNETPAVVETSVVIDAGGNSPNTGLSAGAFAARERRNSGQNDRRISSYLLFDLTDPSIAATIANPGFGVSLTLDYVSRLNDINSSSVSIGRVTTAAWDSTTTPPLHAYGYDSATGSASAADVIDIIANLATEAPTGQTLTIDVTTIVSDWVRGDQPNFGFVLFINQLEAQAAGFDNPQLVFTTPPDDDGDGMPNDYETSNSTPTNPLDPNDPADANVDNDANGGPDGLTNLEEFIAGTDPQNSDTDGDTLSDGDEVSGILNTQYGNAPTSPRSADSDEDGLNDNVELSSLTYTPFGGAPISVITNPNAKDTDADGMEDAVEAQNGLDPTDGTGDNGPTGDADSDDLDNTTELSIGTNPGNPDTDGDGLLDGEEVSGEFNPYQTLVDGDEPTSAPGLETDPTIADTDGDGVSDGDELFTTNGSLSNPRSTDTDGDLLYDGFEVANGFDPADFSGDDSFGDPDMDGVDNYNEQEFGIDPHDSDTDDDGLLDGGDFSNDETGELDTTDPLTAVLFTNPNDPDTDGDFLSDGDEVNLGNTNPNLADSDFDTFSDGVEVAAGSDPNLDTSTPTLATITWTVEALDSASDLNANGSLLLADNLNGPEATVNGIPFSSAMDETAFFSSEKFATQMTTNAGGDNFYADEDPSLSPILESIWTGGDDRTLSIYGLTPGLPYVIQLGRADDRDQGTVAGRFLVVDGVGGETTTDPVGATNTVFGGSANPAILFTGTFTAVASVQSFELKQYRTGEDPALLEGASVLNFIQVRQTDDLSVGSVPEIQIISAGFNGMNFDVAFENLDPANAYQLVRTTNLLNGFLDIVDGPRTPAATTDTYSDTTPPVDEAYYRLEEVSE